MTDYAGQKTLPQRALQMLYRWDMRKDDVAQGVREYFLTLWSEEQEEKPPSDPFMEELAYTAAKRLNEIDRLIEKHAENWRIERMPLVDRNVLRVAVCELISQSTPPAVVIDEAIELARRYAGEESGAVVNGVLDAVNRSLQRGKPATPALPQPASQLTAGGLDSAGCSAIAL